MNSRFSVIVSLLTLCLYVNCQNANNLSQSKDLFYYFNFGYENVNKIEFKILKENIVKKYNYIPNLSETGYLTIRFIVDTLGNHRNTSILQVDSTFHTKTFDKSIIEKLTQIVMSIGDWKVHRRNNKAVEYLMFITFKLQNGKIVDIYP